MRRLLPHPKPTMHVFSEEGTDASRQLNNVSVEQQVVFDWLDAAARTTSSRTPSGS